MQLMYTIVYRLYHVVPLCLLSPSSVPHCKLAPWQAMCHEICHMAATDSTKDAAQGCLSYRCIRCITVATFGLPYP